tara:strand:- start:22344 stop:22490 length:147 start_codon:yes stop_codon:yes gene_type:complete
VQKWGQQTKNQAHTIEIPDTNKRFPEITASIRFHELNKKGGLSRPPFE